MTVVAFIAAQRAEHRVPFAVSCRALGVSQAWFYKWCGGDASLRRARREVLAALVGWLFVRHRRRYGSPRTAAARKAPDLLRRNFNPPAAPNVAWVGDLTEIPTDEGKLYWAAVLDLHSRRIVGFALGEHHDPQLATAALQTAIAVRGGNVAGVIFHTDQGGEYTGGVFRAACARAKVRQCMGRTGSALDNAAAESLNSTLEFELLADSHFHTRAQARTAVADWVQEYNEDRRHSTNGMLAPAAYERAVAARKEAA